MRQTVLTHCFHCFLLRQRMLLQVLLLDIVVASDLASMIDHRCPCVETDLCLGFGYPVPTNYTRPLLSYTSLSVWIHVSCVLCVETWWWSRRSASCLQQPSQLSRAEDARPATASAAVIMSYSHRRHWHTDHTSLLASASRQRTSSYSLLVSSGHLRLPGGSIHSGSTSCLHR